MHIRLVGEIEALPPTQEAGEKLPIPQAIHFVDKVGYTELHICSYSHVGHMHQVSGLFFAHFINVREARTYTKRDTKMAVEIYRVVDCPPYLTGQSAKSP